MIWFGKRVIWFEILWLDLNMNMNLFNHNNNSADDYVQLNSCGCWIVKL